MNKKLTIAIDGYSSTGKSSFAKTIAQRLGYIFVDTGAMYRAVTWYALQHGMIAKDGTIDTAMLINNLSKIQVSFHHNPDTGQSETLLNGQNVEAAIRSMEVSGHVSPVSAIPEVRQLMVQQQQEMGKNGGLVMDGRDIGTVVFPDADIKLFMTAQPEVRAMRRYNELKAKGENVLLEDIAENIRMRDYEDTHRATSPLCKAADAVELDNSHMTPDEQLVWFDKLLAKFCS